MQITAAQVKQLREKTGAGMMDCKSALLATSGDMEKAVDHLRKAGILKAAKRAERATGQGLIASYVHAGAKLAVLVEVNCETDFVARTDQFQTFAKDVAMHVAAQNPQVISREMLPEDTLERERAIYREQALASGKPENIVDRIVDGKVEKFYSEVCLLEQPFVKDTDITVEDLLKQTIATLGENIRIARFVRLELGETAPKGQEEASGACCL
ncbi:MAG: translation elongation factor Ts [Candidatus Eisenbacteria bacterium]|nr:translation elongation factor Ts [Candidatus Eisenbacteria bacterium]